MAKKTGVGTLIRLVRKILRLINLYFDIIRVLSEDDTDTVAALVAMQKACVDLASALGPLLTYGD